MALRTILVIDDDEENRLLLRRMLEDCGFRVETARDGLEGLAKLRLGADGVLVDLLMPGMDGFEVIRRLRADPQHRDLPVLMLTGSAHRDQRKQAIEVGATDFLRRPIEFAELRFRVESALALRDARRRIRHLESDLEVEVARQTSSLRELIDDAVAAQRASWQAQLDTLTRLAIASEYRDQNTAAHQNRIADYCVIIADALGLPPGEAETLRYASPLHDVGKIGIPDAILLKPGALDPSERRIMETHVEIGARMLSGSSSPLLQAGEVIAWGHHERFDGRGYPRGLAGEAIPLPARICAVADFFDALTTDRVYRKAVAVEATFEMMRELRGAHFDPEVLDAFFALEGRVRGVQLSAAA
jgi:putative two-component system response regulator